MKKLISILALLLGLLAVSASAKNELLNIGENLRHERVLLPPSAPDKSRLVVTDYVMFVEQGGGVGISAFYDDVRTAWEIDSIELYDVGGSLLLVSWIDRFGVRWVAMDRGLLDTKNPTVDSVLVLVMVGTSL